jgi:hypothetical protein
VASLLQHHKRNGDSESEQTYLLGCGLRRWRGCRIDLPVTAHLHLQMAGQNEIRLTNPKSAYITRCGLRSWRLSGIIALGLGGRGEDKSAKRVPRRVQIAQVETALHRLAYVPSYRSFAPANGRFSIRRNGGDKFDDLAGRGLCRCCIDLPVTAHLHL